MTQPPKPAARNRADVSTHTARCRRAMALLRELAEQTDYMSQGPYLTGLDTMMDELESGKIRLMLGGEFSEGRFHL